MAEENEWHSSTISYIKMTDVDAAIAEATANISGSQIPVSTTPPSNPQIGDLWIDTSE